MHRVYRRTAQDRFLPGLALIVSFLLFILFPGSSCALLQPNSSWPYVPPGMEYIQRRVGNQPWSIHIVKIDRERKDFHFITSLARDRVLGLATVRTQVGSLPSELGKPIMAVNGDFFVIRPGPYQGDPTGLHIVQGELVSAAHGTSFWIDADSQPHIGEVHGRLRITGPNDFSVNAGLNEQCADDSAVLYTPRLGSSTRTSPCHEYILGALEKSNWLPLRMGHTYDAQILATCQNGDTVIRADTMVLSIGPAFSLRLPKLPVGAHVRILATSSPSLIGAGTVIGGGPILIQDGKPRSWKGSQPRHPRTVLGYNRDQFFLVVVDGRQKGLSIGMNYPELTSLMMDLGCTNAINLDGGGSSTLWLDGQVMNEPSDGCERAVANSLILVQSQDDR